MIICRTPYRISFFGGGTDYPAWYLKHGGLVLSTTIDKYCYITCRYLPPFFQHKYRIVWSKIENCNDISEIEHPSVREVLRHLNIDRGVEIHHVGDLPARSGMGSSSAFTVGLLHGMYALKGCMPGKEQLSKESIYVEQELLKEKVGSQDQVSVAYGGFNLITFLPDGGISVRPVTLSRDRIGELNAHLMLFYTGIVRTSSTISETYINDIDTRKRQLRILKDLVEESISVLSSGSDITEFGELLREAWEAKRSLSMKVSNTYIDEFFSEALSAGALGGKITGAGGGGFMLLFVPPERQRHVSEKLKKLVNVPIKLEFSGSQIIFFDLEKDYLLDDSKCSENSFQVLNKVINQGYMRI